MFMNILTLFLLISLSFADIFVVYSLEKTGYPKEKRYGAVYVVEILKSSDNAIFLAEEIKLRTGKDVFVGRFKDEKDFKKHVSKMNMLYLASCLESSLYIDFAKYRYFNQRLFREDVVKAIRSIKKRLGVKKVRLKCEVNSLEGLYEKLSVFGNEVPEVKLIARELERYLSWHRSSKAKRKI